MTSSNARAQISPASIGLGFLFLVWSSSGIFGAVRKGLNAATHLRKGRPYWHGKLIDFALIPALGLLIVLSVGLTAMARFVVERVDEVGPVTIDTNTTLRIAGYVLPAFVSFSMFSLLYRYVPTMRPPWREALGGADVRDDPVRSGQEPHRDRRRLSRTSRATQPSTPASGRRSPSWCGCS